MKRILSTLTFLLILFPLSFGQYNHSGFVLSGGIHMPMYIGNGEGDNHFVPKVPGFQFEMTFNNYNNFEWIIWGISHANTTNVAADHEVPVSFWSPYYTEFLFYQADKKNPLFMCFGYDYIRMKFPNTEKPDSHYNLTFGAGWNVRMLDRIFLQFKVKPYFVLGNSIGQWFGTNVMLNIHLGVSN